MCSNSRRRPIQTAPKPPSPHPPSPHPPSHHPSRSTRRAHGKHPPIPLPSIVRHFLSPFPITRAHEHNKIRLLFGGTTCARRSQIEIHDSQIKNANRARTHPHHLATLAFQPKNPCARYCHPETPLISPYTSSTPIPSPPPASAAPPRAPRAPHPAPTNTGIHIPWPSEHPPSDCSPAASSDATPPSH